MQQLLSASSHAYTRTCLSTEGGGGGSANINHRSWYRQRREPSRDGNQVEVGTVDKREPRIEGSMDKKEPRIEGSMDKREPRRGSANERKEPNENQQEVD
jgi:hypothetical protein